MDKFYQIKIIFEQNADSEKAVYMKKYMRDKFEFYGIASPKRKKLLKDFINNEKKLKKIDWDFLDKCYEDEYRELQYAALDYLGALKKYLVFEDIEKIYSYVKKKQWWDTIDFLDRIIGFIGLKDSRVDELMLKWSLSDDMWLRRLSIDHQIGRKEKTNTELLEKIILNNLESKEFFINKAIGWSLRDYSKVNPKLVKDFIEKYFDKLNSLSIKEGSKYI